MGRAGRRTRGRGCGRRSRRGRPRTRPAARRCGSSRRALPTRRSRARGATPVGAPRPWPGRAGRPGRSRTRRPSAAGRHRRWPGRGAGRSCSRRSRSSRRAPGRRGRRSRRSGRWRLRRTRPAPGEPSPGSATSTPKPSSTATGSAVVAASRARKRSSTGIARRRACSTSSGARPEEASFASRAAWRTWGPGAGVPCARAWIRASPNASNALWTALPKANCPGLTSPGRRST